MAGSILPGADLRLGRPSAAPRATRSLPPASCSYCARASSKRPSDTRIDAALNRASRPGALAGLASAAAMELGQRRFELGLLGRIGARRLGRRGRRPGRRRAESAPAPAPRRPPSRRPAGRSRRCRRCGSTTCSRRRRRAAASDHAADQQVLGPVLAHRRVGRRQRLGQLVFLEVLSLGVLHSWSPPSRRTPQCISRPRRPSRRSGRPPTGGRSAIRGGPAAGARRRRRRSASTSSRGMACISITGSNPPPARALAGRVALALAGRRRRPATVGDPSPGEPRHAFVHDDRARAPGPGSSGRDAGSS